mmetsp:Transcript_74283/g.215254  ORF Transcript_74283/g.215254 Transcript_74283/m.215254 type:complete len:234 (+) Transcript_74283:3353-4054(+)
MPFSRAAISSVSVAMASFAVAMALSSSEMERCKVFFWSSVVSNCSAQYSFLSSSSLCSVLRTPIMSSTILMTFSKPPWFSDFLPASVSINKSRAACWLLGAAARALTSTSMARLRCFEAPEANCTKLELAEGSVFLKRSNASSSLRTLIVSASATSSSARVLERSSHSAVFVAQLSSNPFRNFWSAKSAAWVSVKSSFICTMLTPNSPICVVFASMAAPRASTSLLLALIISL